MKLTLLPARSDGLPAFHPMFWFAGFLLCAPRLSPNLLASAEKLNFDLDLPASSEFVHYTKTFLRAPGRVDLSKLEFIPVAESYGDVHDHEDENDGDNEVKTLDEGGEVDGEEEDPPRRSNHYRRVLSGDSVEAMGITGKLDGGAISGNLDKTGAAVDSRRLEGGFEEGASQVDILVFKLPNECASTRSGCDWTDLGIGTKIDDGYRWCCTDEVISKGLCYENRKGRLIWNQTTYEGRQRSVEVSKVGTKGRRIRKPKMEWTDSGQYVLALANCDVDGREVRVEGAVEWESEHGFLPGERYGFMWFYALLTVIYIGLAIWYGVQMAINAESRIPIEKWILMTIAMGLMEMVFRSLDYFIWNESGYRFEPAVYLGILVGVSKRAISRCLMVMVSLGWGVVRDSLGSTMPWIIVLGAAYTAVSAALEFVNFYAAEDIEKLTNQQEKELFDIVTVLTFIIAAFDVVFILWILDSLNGTMQYLESNSQNRKLKRYLTLRCILLFAILFATVWIVFSLVDNYDEDGIVQNEHQWIVEAATEVNYLFVLFGVAVLWMPNPDAKEYAYVMELPSMGGDDCDGETELELTGVIPSAMDDDDEYDDEDGASGQNGYHDDDQKDGRFRID